MPSFVLSTLHPVRTSFPTRRSSDLLSAKTGLKCRDAGFFRQVQLFPYQTRGLMAQAVIGRSEEHTSELQSRGHLVCRLLLEKKKIINSPVVVLNHGLRTNINTN